MLVDLARNDVGRVAEFGSVTVPEYLRVHRYSKIMHLASVVEGRLRGGLDACDALQAILPAGTLSGAPKIRACQIIAELEGRPRGVYGGAVGYLDFSGNMDVCIAIRMAVKQGDKVTVQAGPASWRTACRSGNMRNRATRPAPSWRPWPWQAR